MTSQETSHAENTNRSEIDTGLDCLVMMVRLHEMTVDPDQLAHTFKTDGKPFSKAEILLASKKIGLETKVVKTSIDRLDKTPLPAMAMTDDGRFFVLARRDGEQVLIYDPEIGRPVKMPLDQLNDRWNRELILFKSRASVAGDMAKFDFTWFIPAIMKYRRLLGEVLIVSFALQLFALMTPLFFQVVMDKVLVHRGFTTLDVLAFGLLVVIIFEVTLNALRGYVFAHTTSRIDVELGAKLFRHLINRIRSP
ncbi:cysteine peptidase family C39 domain-containing protein [Thermodesulfobacteriota bacterium]